MRAKELVPILAEKFGVIQETADVIDRSLAVGELRRLGKGRSWPMMTREEAITFLLACLITERPTKAAEEVRSWLQTEAKVNEEPLLVKVLKGGRKKILDIDDWDMNEREFPEVPRVEFCRSIERYFKDKRNSDNSVGLGVYLKVICNLLSDGLMTPNKLKLDVVRSLGMARLSYTNDDGKVLLEDTFWNAAAQQQHRLPSDANITVTASVSGYALTEIILRTTDDIEVPVVS